MVYYRYKMSRWSDPDRSAILSLLLDEVTGTEEATAVRQDYCRLKDYFISTCAGLDTDSYFTGSKAEGLDLPGSDVDYMIDINNVLGIKVVQSLHEPLNTSDYCSSVLSIQTDNIPPGFALLCCKKIVNPIMHKLHVVQSFNGEQYFSSNLLLNISLQHIPSSMVPMHPTRKRQGPSLETWFEYDIKSESGIDFVMSIHCAFWPNNKSEWLERPRHFGWPTARDISAIVNFGFHLVPVGHPNSDTKFIEWRFSFSIAEKILVWSFNHIQMQCYAVMKIILKEFIKKKCSEQNQVLCSYFIKTFLFWEFETTDATFWREDNFRECIKYLLNEFKQHLEEGVIKHYFFPRFNLLSVKLTREAQAELLQLFDIIIQGDINVLKECETLQNVWLKFLSADKNQLNIIHNAKKANFLENEALIISYLQSTSLLSFIQHDVTYPIPIISDQLIGEIQSLPCKTCLKSLMIYSLLFKKFVKSSKLLQQTNNKGIYQLQRIANDQSSQYDLSTCKTWYAIALLKKHDYTSTLNVVNHVLNSIPQFVLYETATIYVSHESTAATEQYVEKFLNSELEILERAQKAWIEHCIG